MPYNLLVVDYGLVRPGTWTAYEPFQHTKQNQERGKKYYSDDGDSILETTLLIYLSRASFLTP